MALRAKILGREALTRRMRQIVPNAIAEMDKVKLEVAEEAAQKIAERAPKSVGGGNYAASIRGGYLRDNPDKKANGIRQTKDPTAVGVFGNFIWRFLEFGTKASLSQEPQVDRRYKSGKVQTKGKRPHAATPAMPHVFPVWRGMRPKAMRKMRLALNRGVRKAMGK